MKVITTLTAIAALFVGISLASAQNSGSMNSDKSTNATGNGKFCIEISKGGGKECTYASMAACEKDAQPNGLQCSPNTSTTGSKE
jgi:hypothetical protein